MNQTPTAPRDLADEALAALRAAAMNPREHFEFLVDQGIIDRTGRVLIAKLFGANGHHDAQISQPKGQSNSKS